MARRIIARIVIDGTDDEFGRDEYVHREYLRERVLDDRTAAFDIDVPDVRWGEECRVEVDITGQLVNRQDVDIDVTGKLFEGWSDGTQDLEDQKRITFTVRRGGAPVHRSIFLRNTELGGGDHATIRLSFTNSLVEE